MTDAVDNLPKAIDAQPPHQMQPSEPIRVSDFRRDLFPSNLVLSADDLREFCELLVEANVRARELEFNKLDLSAFDSPEQARQRVNELMPIEYNYVAQNGDSMQGLGIPKTDERTFPEDLRTIFLSNSTFAKRAINMDPLNTVDVFLSFEKPSMKIDFEALPSNPTANRSVINVAGRDEDWVISTAQKVDRFLSKRRSIRPIIHGSGTYDYFVYLVFLPAAIWLFYVYGASLSASLGNQTVFLNVVLGIYGVLVTFFAAHFLFKYIRWLFPPMEYYKRSRIGAFIHRGVAITLVATVVLSATYDLIKMLVLAMLA